MRSMRIIAALGALMAATALAAPAKAADLSTGASSALVRGGAPLPSFNTSFPIDLDHASTPAESDQNLEISLTSPDHGVLRFLFSPRAISGETGFGSTVTGNYAGLAWNIFDNSKFFGSIGLTGAVNREALDNPNWHLYGPLLSMHSTFELGYAFNAQQSLSLSLDHATPAPFFGNDLRLRYGLHF